MDREVGIFLAVIASAGILYGGLTTPRVEAARRARERPRRPLATEEFEQPPPGMGGRRRAESPAVGAEQEAAAPTAEPTPEPPRLARERRFEADEDLSWSEPSPPPGGGGSTEVRPPRRSREPPERR